MDKFFLCISRYAAQPSLIIRVLVEILSRISGNEVSLLLSDTGIKKHFWESRSTSPNAHLKSFDTLRLYFHPKIIHLFRPLSDSILIEPTQFFTKLKQRIHTHFS